MEPDVDFVIIFTFSFQLTKESYNTTPKYMQGILITKERQNK